ncbi:MAG: ShlB/FhaC/HecB family hemolysin secretion/activation protein [Tropicimonas sp.]
MAFTPFEHEDRKCVHVPCARAASRRGAKAFLAAACGVLLAVGAATAQTASEVTPRSFRPEPQRLTGSVDFSGAGGFGIPEGAEQLSIAVAGVDIENALPEMAAANRAMAARLTTGRIPVAEIFRAAEDLQTAYVKNGFVLTRVVLPQQQLVDGGRLRILVVNGFVERIRDTGLPERVAGRIDALTEPVLNRPGIGSELERRLLMAGDVPGVSLASALSTGVEPGGTVLSLQAMHKPVTGFVGIDNSLGDELGNWSLDTSLQLNSLLKQGETIYFWASGNPFSGVNSEKLGFASDSPQLRTLAGGIIYPIGTNGLSFNAEYTDSRTSPEDVIISTTSRFERLSLRLRYPFVRSRLMNVNGQFAFDVQSEDLDILTSRGDFPIYRDDIRVFRLSGDFYKKFESSGATLSAAAVLSVGVDGLGARSAADASPTLPLSRNGADAAYTKLELYADYFTPLRRDFALSLFGRGQTSFGDPLVSSEQIGLVGPQALSTFDMGTLNGDSGWVVRGELSRQQTFATAMPVDFSPYVFAATGAAYFERPGRFEPDAVRASSYGLGLDLLVTRDPRYSDMALRAEYGRGYRDDLDTNDGRFTVYGSFRF